MCEAMKGLRNKILTLKTGQWEPLPRLLNSFFVVGKYSIHPSHINYLELQILILVKDIALTTQKFEVMLTLEKTQQCIADWHFD